MFYRFKFTIECRNKLRISITSRPGEAWDKSREGSLDIRQRPLPGLARQLLLVSQSVGYSPAGEGTLQEPMGDRADGSAGQWVGPRGGLFDEGPAVGKMAAASRPSWWQRWRRHAWARDGAKLLLFLLLLGSGPGPRHVRAGQAVEYLKREHSLSKPYQGEAPGARWSCREGLGTESGLSSRTQSPAGGGAPRISAPLKSHRSEGQGSAPHPRPFPSARSF